MVFTTGDLLGCFKTRSIFFLLNRPESRSALELKGELFEIPPFFRSISRFRSVFNEKRPIAPNNALKLNRMNRATESEVVKQPFRIICVCLGNICRSPAAQGVLERLIQRACLKSQFQVDSAGTASYHIGRPPDARMLAAAAKRDYQLTSVAKSLTKAMIEERQLILAMDRKNYVEIVEIADGETERIRMWSDYLDESWPREVPDPYYGGQLGFEYVLDMFEAAGPRILAECVQAAGSKR